MVTAAGEGWDVLGIEFDEGVAARLRRTIGHEVLSHERIEAFDRSAEVIHFGDVLEHLVDPGETFQWALNAVRAGGLVIVHGPLENGKNLFTLVMRVLGKLGPNRSETYLRGM